MHMRILNDGHLFEDSGTEGKIWAVLLLFVLFCYYCVVQCIDLCTVTLPQGVNPIAVDKYIYLSIYLQYSSGS